MFYKSLLVAKRKVRANGSCSGAAGAETVTAAADPLASALRLLLQVGPAARCMTKSNVIGSGLALTLVCEWVRSLV